MSLYHRASRRYAQALFELCEERRCTDAVRADLQKLAALLAASPELRAFAADSSVPEERRRTALAATLGGGQELTGRFLGLLAVRRRLAWLPEMIEIFGELYDRSRGLADAAVVSATPLTPAEQEQLRGKLETRSGLKIRLQTQVDPALLGGFTVRIGDRVDDFSLAARLDKCRAQLAR